MTRLNESTTTDDPAPGQGVPAYAEVPRTYYDIVVAVFVALLLLSGVTAAKLFYGPVVPAISDLFYGGGPLIFDGGAFLFPLSYILGDVLTEVYGFRRARRAIVVGFVLLILAAVTYRVVGLTTPVEGFEAWDTVLAPVTRITIAGLVGFLAGGLVNAKVLARLKARMAERHVALRLIVSTLVGQFFDTLLFCVIAFAGTISLIELVNYTATGYVYKCAVEVLLVPLTLMVIARLKRLEPTYRVPAAAASAAD